MRKTLPVAGRVLGASHDYTLRIRTCSARAIYEDPAATLDALREAVTMLEDSDRIARRVFGGSHPHTSAIEHTLQEAQAALGARETPSTSA